MVADAGTGYGNPINMRRTIRDYEVATFKQFTEIAGLPEIQQLEERYGVPEGQRTSL